MKITQLGDYMLEKRIGSGGMGEVFRARQVSLDRTVAVKVLPRSLASQQGFTERFQREARAAANLIHPNVIQVYSIGLDKGIPYFAMEYVEGEDLQQRMKRQRFFDFDEIVRIIRDATSALTVAHEKGIVHRDIKPSNIMFDRTGNLKVMDFGLAKITAANSNLTQSGLIMGTPNYMSPEQGKGEPTDTRSDIYSLGVVFYELMTGSLPFRADTPTALIYKHAYEKPPSPREKNPEIPPYLEYVCLRMISKDPNDRYAAPPDLLKDLEEFIRDRTFYMSGGMPESKDLMTDQTMVDAPGTGRVPAAQAAPVGQGQSQVNTAHYASNSGAMSQQTAAGAVTQPGSHTAHTVAAHTTSAGQATQAQTLLEGQTLPGYRQPPGSNGWKIFAMVLLVLAGLGFGFREQIYTAWKNATNPPPVLPDKVEMHLEDLHGFAASVRTDVIISWLPEEALDFLQCPNVPRPVVPGKYHFRLERHGYETQEFAVQVLKDGQIEPPLDSKTIRNLFAEESWEAGKELTDAYEAGVSAMRTNLFQQAIPEFDKVLAIDEGYEDAQVRHRKCLDMVGEYEGKVLEVTSLVSKSGTAFTDKNLTRAKDLSERALELCTDPQIENDKRIVAYQREMNDRLSQIKRDLEMLEDKFGDAMEDLDEGDWQGAREKFKFVERGNTDDTRPARMIDTCKEMQELLDRIQLSFQHQKEDRNTRTMLETYLATCSQHDQAKELLSQVIARIGANETTREKIDSLVAQINQEVSPENVQKDWAKVIKLCDEILTLDEGNQIAVTNKDIARKQLDKGGVDTTFSELGAALLEPDFDVRKDEFRRLVHDGDFEDEWQRFLTENTAELKLVTSSFLIHDTNFEGDVVLVDGRWHYELLLLQFERKLSANSAFRARLERDSDRDPWAIVEFEKISADTEGTLE